MKKLIALGAIVALSALPAVASQDPAKPAAKPAAATASDQWTGYITDTHCGEKGANKDHTVECVEKCMKGGAKPQIMSETDKKLYTLDSFEKVKALMGNQVTVKGKLDAASNTIAVESAAKASK